MTEVISEEERERLVPCRVKSQKSAFSFGKAVFVYALGGLTGTVWETLLNLFSGNGFVFCNGSIFTPFNFVYGFGALVIIACLRGQTKWWKVYIAGALGGGAVEFLLNFLEETLLGTRSWNYDSLPLNICGRTTLPFMAGWGLLCVVVVFAVYRPLDKLLDRIPKKTLTIIAIVLSVIIVIDLTFTVSAILRYSARSAGEEALTFIGRFLDRAFNDDFMKLRFPKTRF